MKTIINVSNTPTNINYYIYDNTTLNQRHICSYKCQHSTKCSHNINTLQQVTCTKNHMHSEKCNNNIKTSQSVKCNKNHQHSEKCYN